MLPKESFSLEEVPFAKEKEEEMLKPPLEPVLQTSCVRDHDGSFHVNVKKQKRGTNYVHDSIGTGDCKKIAQRNFEIL